jgi:hypothetical protein
MTNKKVRFLARLYMSDMLLRIDLPADAEPPRVGTVHKCEVDRVREEGGGVRLVAATPGTRTVLVDLPSWMLKDKWAPPPWHAEGDDVRHLELVEAVRENEWDRLRAAMLSWLEVMAATPCTWLTKRRWRRSRCWPRSSPPPRWVSATSTGPRPVSTLRCGCAVTSVCARRDAVTLSRS